MHLASAEITFHGDGHPPPGRTRHLHVVLAIDARLGKQHALDIAMRWHSMFIDRHLQVSREDDLDVEPFLPVPDPWLPDRMVRVTAIADRVLSGRIGLEARLTSRPDWGGHERIDVLVLRDDVIGSDDESGAADAIGKAILAEDESLAALVNIDSDYIK